MSTCLVATVGHYKPRCHSSTTAKHTKYNTYKALVTASPHPLPQIAPSSTPIASKGTKVVFVSRGDRGGQRGRRGERERKVRTMC